MDAKARTVALVRAQRFVSGKPHRRRKIPKQSKPALIVREYERALAALVSRAVIREAFTDLLRELPGLMASAKRERGDSEHVDADEGKRARALIATAKQRLSSAVSTQKIEGLAEQFAQRTATFQRVQLNKQTKAVLGTDIFTGDRGMGARIAGFATENVSLIKGISEEIAIKVEKRVTRALTSATLHADLAKELDQDFDFGEKRAKLIARDQIGKFYGQINASRQQDLGVTHFTWVTVGDERVREEDDPEDDHVALDGQVFPYDDPPFGMLPGEPILCRCSAEPVFDDIVNEADPSDETDNTESGDE